MQRVLVPLVCALALAAAFVTPASAQVKFGPRFGYSFDPDQFVLGAHLMAPLAKGLYVVPSAEFAFGDDATTIALNGDLHYRIATGGGVTPYLGGGVAWVTYDPDAEGADSFDDVGFNLLGGIWFNLNKDTPVFVEGKFGVSDEMPDFKIMAGLNL